MENLFYAGSLKARHKTTLQLIQEVKSEFTSPQTWNEIEARKLGYLFARNMPLQEVYEMCKLKNIDLLFIRGED
jgi:hypothetical protein